MRLQLAEKQPKAKGPKQDCQADSLGILAHKNWTKLLLVTSASSVMPDSAKSAMYIRREVKKRCICKFCIVPLDRKSVV
jgi:hypothetical protein